jgi:hypothetical protein
MVTQGIILRGSIRVGRAVRVVGRAVWVVTCHARWYVMMLGCRSSCDTVCTSLKYSARSLLEWNSRLERFNA